MIRTDKRMGLCWLLLICNLAFIWGNSLLPAELSQAFSDWVKTFLVGLATGEPSLGDGSGMLRKLAHFAEFTALGMVLSWLFGMLRKKKHWPLVCGVAAACVDETIQLFVPDRGPGLKDVLLDSCGVLTGMMLLYLGHTILSKKQHKCNRRNNTL